MDFYSQDYDNNVILGGFNLEPSNPFMNNQNLFNLVKRSTCLGEYSCIDLILINRKYSFMNIFSFESGLGDHHHLIYSVMKTTFKSEEPKNIKIQIFLPNVLELISYLQYLSGKT